MKNKHESANTKHRYTSYMIFIVSINILSANAFSKDLDKSSSTPASFPVTLANNVTNNITTSTNIATNTTANTSTDDIVAIKWGETKTISLDEAFALALKNSPDIATVKSRLDQTRLIKSKVSAALQPTIGLATAYTRNDSEVTFGIGKLVQGYTDYQLATHGMQPTPVQSTGDTADLYTALNSSAVIQPYNLVGAQLYGQWVAFSGRTYPLLKQAKGAIEVAENATRWAEQEILYGVAQLYYNVYTLQQLIDVSKKQADSKTRHLELAKNRFQAGQIAQSEVIRAEVEVAQARRQYRETLQSYENLSAEFAAFLGLSDISIKTLPPPSAETVDGSIDSLTEKALSTRKDALIATTQIGIAKNAIKDSRYDFFPTVLFSGNYRYSNAGGFSGENWAWSVGATLSFSIWDGGMRMVTLRESREKYNQTLENKKKIDLQIKKEMQIAYANIKQSESNLLAAKEELRLARTTYDQVFALYKAGRVTSLELRDVELMVNAAELANVRSELSVGLSKLALQRASGLFEKETVEKDIAKHDLTYKKSGK